ncbi:methylated-DNA--[protein]-cysteine S-methyltransferase [Paludifilum halophilum]|uniref:Methylated-DNA--protein-cysteine methyltransferase n=1 Tax=Paludifilum halophilum TaxID=1642702 RepID=A0A235B885_9BACL|nr:methylated-DNA--[protein]-cysteine S-methyltransferase [Paludifilum halophilum]OYD08504.1 [Fe-S]-binding protein [Paludifilum halophilum]
MVTGSRVIAWSEMESPVGPIVIAATNKGLCRLDFDRGEQTRIGRSLWAKEWIGSIRWERNDVELAPIVQQLKEYFDGVRTQFDLPVDLYGTAFQKLVWRQLQGIPYGEVRSYKDIAQAMGAPKAVRAVGGANNKNPVSIVVPCHRVIGSNGSLVGYGAGLKVKEFLLGLEGALPYKAQA